MYPPLKKYIDDIYAIQNSFINDSQSLDLIINAVLKLKDGNGKLVIIGNGGSSATASHMAIDFSKLAGIPTLCFSDASLLTALGNDCDFENVFKEAIQMHIQKTDILIAISASGESENILRGVDAAKSIDCLVITLSGFQRNNQLSQKGNYNLWIDSTSYGYVEMTHHIILHYICDTLVPLNSSKL